MEDIFNNLERIQSIIRDDPGSFEVTSPDIIFGLLEESSMENVLEKIRKKKKRPTSDEGSPQQRRPRKKGSPKPRSPKAEGSPKQRRPRADVSPLRRPIRREGSPRPRRPLGERFPQQQSRGREGSPQQGHPQAGGSPNKRRRSRRSRSISRSSRSSTPRRGDQRRSPSQGGSPSPVAPRLAKKRKRAGGSPTPASPRPGPSNARTPAKAGGSVHDTTRGSDSSVILVEDSPAISPGIKLYKQLSYLKDLRSIFPDASILNLKKVITNNPGFNQDALVNIILENQDLLNDSSSTPASPFQDTAASTQTRRKVASESLQGLKNKTADVTLEGDILNETAAQSDPWNSGFFEADLIGIFPHLDPEYLAREAIRIGDDDEAQQQFINASLGKSGLPTRKDYEARQAKKEQVKSILKLKVSDFLMEYDNPVEYFNNNTALPSNQYKESCKQYLFRKFPKIEKKKVERVLEEKQHRFLPSLKALKEMPASRGGKKGVWKSVSKDKMDLTFLKEYIFYKLEDKVKEAQKREAADRDRRIAEARETGALFSCQCCYDDECLLEEVVMCPADHMFCRDCLRRGAEVQIGDNKTQISCFSDQCDKQFALQTLDGVLQRKTLEKLIERQQAEDLNNAAIENLEQCPACNYAVIIPESEKLIHCKSVDCGKVSCRLCREESHVPLRCEEVEKDDEVKARTKLENAMTEAMIRQCPKCKNRFFKTEGCNLMHCTCGATMCYLCRKEVPDNYKHFYGQGCSPRPGLCPLFSDNANLHKSEVVKAAEAARPSGGVTLKHDPTKSLDRPPQGFNPNRIFLGQVYGDEYDSDESSEEEEDVDEIDSDTFNEEEEDLEDEEDSDSDSDHPRFALY